MVHGGHGALLPPLWFLRRTRNDGGWKTCAVATLVVLGLFGGGLAWYNYARFDSPFQFGQALQLTSLKEGNWPHFGLRFIPYNLRAYFILPVQWTADWPFIASPSLPPGPSGYFSGEEMYCLAVLFPTNWFILIGLWKFVKKSNNVAAEFRSMMILVLAVLLPICLLILSFFYCAERYMVEFTPTLMLGALCGVLIAEDWFHSVFARITVKTLIGVAATVTILSGILASFDFHGRSMKQTAPETWDSIASRPESIVRSMRDVFRGKRR